MVNTKLSPRSVHFSIPFSKGSQMNPLARPHSEAAMWFYASQNLLMGVGCCFLVTDVFNGLFYIPRLVLREHRWIRPARTGSRARGSQSSSCRIAQAQTHPTRVTGSGSPSGSVSVPFPWEWVREGVGEGEVLKLRLCRIGGERDRENFQHPRSRHHRKQQQRPLLVT